MSYRAVAIVAVFLVAGCVSEDRGHKPEQSRSSDFDSASEPAFTAKTYYAAGQFAESQNNVPKAIEQYTNAIKLDPVNQPSLYRLGILYARLGQYPQAISVWLSYVKATDGSALAYSNLGFCYQLAGNLTEAEAAYKTGLAKDPGNRSCHVNYGLLLAHENQIDAALVQWQIVLTPAEAHYNLASFYEQQGDKAKAIIEYQKSAALDPNFKDARSKLAGLTSSTP